MLTINLVLLKFSKYFTFMLWLNLGKFIFAMRIFYEKVLKWWGRCWTSKLATHDFRLLNLNNLTLSFWFFNFFLVWLSIIRNFLFFWITYCYSALFLLIFALFSISSSRTKLFWTWLAFLFLSLFLMNIFKRNTFSWLK